MRLGILGGSFDPPHVGHLLAANDAAEQLALDRLVFLPASRQPLKRHLDITPGESRLEMLRLMLDGDPRFEVDATEVDRSGLSFTVETLTTYAERFPAAARYFLLGADAFGTLESWRNPGEIVRLAHLAILDRANGGLAAPAGGWKERSAEVERRVREIGGEASLPPVVLATRRVDVSSTEIRERVRLGKPIRGFVTDAVARFIEKNGLYR